MRIIALIAAYNERRFIRPCLEHLRSQGIKAYLLDNESTDETVAFARQFEADVLCSMETFPHLGRYRWTDILKRKEELALELDADWFIHMDPDEFRYPPVWATTLRDAIAEVDQRGFNAINFQEFCFIPTRENPDHDHARFQETMRSYYAYSPKPVFRRTAWKKQATKVNLAESGGHLVSFPGLRCFDENFPMRHYLFLSREQAIAKYRRNYDRAELSRGWHGWRCKSASATFPLPPAAALHHEDGKTELDVSNPQSKHYLEHIFTG